MTDTTEKRPVGRPSLYDPKYCEEVIALGRIGKSVEQIASILNVSLRVLYDWRDKHPEFLHALEVHDESAALPVLATVPTLIACGDRDLLTPVKYSEEMAAALPDSLLVIVPGAGHLVQMERPDVINDALVRLVERATPSRLVAFARKLRGRGSD